MTTPLLFCTSSTVTPELVRELQASNEPWVVPNRFAPARHDPAAQRRPSETEVEDFVEPFEGATDEELRRLLDERIRPVDGDKRNWLDGAFVVLDERSTIDKTAVVHDMCILLPKQDEDDDVDRSDEPLPDPEWWSWRVAIRDCHEMIIMSIEVIEHTQDLLLKGKERWTNADGVFEFKRAVEWYHSPARFRKEVRL